MQPRCLLPVILAYIGHAYWVFRGKVTAAYGEAAGEPRVKAKSGNLASYRGQMASRRASIASIISANRRLGSGETAPKDRQTY